MLAPVAVTTIDTPRPLPTLPPLTLPRRPVSPTKARQLAAVPMAALIHSVGSLSRAGREHSANRKQNQVGGVAPVCRGCGVMVRWLG